MSLQDQFSAGPNISDTYDEAKATADWLNGERLEKIRQAAEDEQAEEDQAGHLTTNWSRMAYRRVLEEGPVVVMTRKVTPWAEPMSHPEDTCQRCGGNNIWSWNVPSDRFNVAMKALGLTSVAIVCPTCFVDGHELATGMRTVWTLQPDSFFHHIGAIEGERPPRTVEPIDPSEASDG